MEIDCVAHAREERRDDIRLAIDRKSGVAHVTLVENLIDSLAIVGTAMRFTHDARTLGCRNHFRHEAPHGETWRGACRFAAAHLICSRRQSGMSEEQPQLSYHGRTG